MYHDENKKKCRLYPYLCIYHSMKTTCLNGIINGKRQFEKENGHHRDQSW